MSKFCGKCGSELNENGLCPNCELTKIAAEKERQIKAAEEKRKATVINETANKNKNNNSKQYKATNDTVLNNSKKDNIYPKELTKKDKRVKEKADKAAEKVKRKAENKTERILTKARNKAENKTDKSAARITKKADKKARKIALMADKKAVKKADKAVKKASRTVGWKIGVFLIKLLAVILALIIAFSAISGVLVYFDIADIPVISNVMDFLGINNDGDYGQPLDENTLSVEKETNNVESTEESYEVTMPDADEYFKNNSKVISEIEVNDSKKVTTEEKTFEVLNDLGFNDYPITTEYSMDGEYYEAIEISASSSTKHPIYQTYYINTNGDIWTIYFINEVVLANPVTYNLQSALQTQLVISESDSVTSYDSTTNKFYETIPNESELIVKKVSKIDAETLNELTVEGIDKL